MRQRTGGGVFDVSLSYQTQPVKFLPARFTNDPGALNYSHLHVQFHWLALAVQPQLDWLTHALKQKTFENPPTFNGGNTINVTHETHISVQQLMISPHSKSMEMDADNTCNACNAFTFLLLFFNQLLPYLPSSHPNHVFFILLNLTIAFPSLTLTMILYC